VNMIYILNIQLGWVDYLLMTFSAAPIGSLSLSETHKHTIQCL
jgi:hypothetical protein